MPSGKAADSSGAVLVVPVQRRTAGGLNGASRGGTWLDYDAVRCPADGYRLLLTAIMAVPSGAAIEEAGDGRRAR